MTFQFDEETEIERWLRPFTSLAIFPGGKRQLLTETRLFWDTYWQLLELGYTETQIANYSVSRIDGKHGMPYTLSLSIAIMRLACVNNVKRSSTFYPYAKGEHPRYRQRDWDSADA